MNVFKLGDKVSWESEAGGSKIKKTGTIVHCLEKGADPMNSVISLCVTNNAKSNYGGGRARNHETYFVLVEEKNKSGELKKPSLYWPRVSSLKIS